MKSWGFVVIRWGLCYPTDIGIIISGYKDPYEPIGVMGHRKPEVTILNDSRMVTSIGWGRRFSVQRDVFLK